MPAASIPVDPSLDQAVVGPEVTLHCEPTTSLGAGDCPFKVNRVSAQVLYCIL